MRPSAGRAWAGSSGHSYMGWGVLVGLLSIVTSKGSELQVPGERVSLALGAPGHTTPGHLFNRANAGPHPSLCIWKPV